MKRSKKNCLAKIDPHYMKRRKNYFLENRKNFHLEKFLDFKNFSKNSKFWKKIQIFEKISNYLRLNLTMPIDLTLVWSKPDLTKLRSPRNRRMFCFFLFSVPNLNGATTQKIPMTPQDPQKLPQLSPQCPNSFSRASLNLLIGPKPYTVHPNCPISP